MATKSGNAAWRKTLGTVSTLMAAGCGLFFVFALHDLIAGDGKTPPDVLGVLALFFGALTAMCGFSAYRAFFMSSSSSSETAQEESAPSATPLALEQHVLALAATNEGCVTVAELALHAGVSLDRAEAALDELTARERADIETTSSGQTVYRVRGLLVSADEKKTARDPLS